MTITIDIKNTNLSRASIFSRDGGGGNSKFSATGGGMLEEFDSIIKLSYKQRLYGFIICLLCGVLIVGLGYVSFSLGRLKPFVLLFTLGNIIAVFSTMFLMGPVRQIKSMFKKGRIIATCVYLGSIIATLYFAKFRHPPSFLLSLLFGVIQLFALIWYSLSYIPYARSLIMRCVGL